jgi:hypothetical protein
MTGCDIEGDEGDAPHAPACGVASTEGGVRCRKDFGEARGTHGKIAGEPTEVVEGGMDAGREADALAVMVVERFLEVTEEATGARDPEQHAPQFAKDLLPLDQGDAFLGRWDRGQDFVEAGDAMGWKRDGLADGVDEPAEDDFTGGPTCVAF